MKRLYSIIIASMLIFSMAACGETANSNEKTESSAKEEEYSEETTPLEEKQEDNNETEVTTEPSKEEAVVSEPAFEEKEIEFPETTILFDSDLEKVELLSFFAKYDESSIDKKPITGFTVRVTNNSDRKIVLKPQEVKLEGKDLALGEIDPISLKPEVSTTRDIVVFKDKELETPIDSIEDLYELTGTFYMSVYNEDNKTVEVTSSGKYEFDISKVQFGVDEALLEAQQEPLLSIVDVFYGDVYQNQTTYSKTEFSDQGLEDFKDCIVVFDYANDATNRKLPESELDQTGSILFTQNITCPEITLCINGVNTYEAYDPNANLDHYSNSLERYTSYSNPIGYGNLLGGSDPVRMYAVFYVNPNDLSTDSTAVITVQDQSVEFSFEEIKEIAYADEILKAEENYEVEQQLAAFKWRMDKMFDLSGEIDHYLITVRPGDDLVGVGDAILNMFIPGIGQTIGARIPPGFNAAHCFEGRTSDLPLFNVEVLTSAYPEQAADISAFVDKSNNLAFAVQDSNYSKDQIRDMLKEIIGIYANLIDAFNMEAYQE